MEFKVAIICLLGVTAINALEELNCKEYPIRAADALSPAETIRVCGVGEYEDIPIIMRTLFGIDKPARHLLPPFKESTNDLDLSRGLFENTPSSKEADWLSKEIEAFAGSRQVAPVASRPYGYEVIKSALPTFDQTIDFQPLLLPAPQTQQTQQTRTATVDDVSALKQLVIELESEVDNFIADAPQRENNNKGKEINLNVVLKLNPFLEQLLNNYIQLKDEEQPEALMDGLVDGKLIPINVSEYLR